ncbi:hypothetical protein FHT80_003920 [Rhizobium sp. BK226]|uniref:hypothetical protein n=1 Tax=Rhizobium sp. BK226 TaxID=2587075 RepID=UPI00182637D3|nr:hypothetical protein [Rhizobium sp. BK226]MBB4114569.1 hypothetical protein [Rhizobium sp. BK226]
MNIYRADGEEIGKKLLKEGFAKTWRPEQRNDWCSGLAERASIASGFFKLSGGSLYRSDGR